MTSVDSIVERVFTYNRAERRFAALQTAVCQPSFNATRDASTYGVYKELGSWLRSEADALWSMGVNVYGDQPLSASEARAVAEGVVRRASVDAFLASI